ncbi:MAG: HK97 gp10 family phage protein [Prevotellaceae bacterium]|nr:HK97 gp10 family phage protein [Prevotellaceae bacterium]
MTLRVDMSDVPGFFEKGFGEVVGREEKVGQEGVGYAKENGTYQDRTGTLRRSSRVEAGRDGVTLVNDAPYASFVESKGYDVLSGAALHVRKRMEEEV